MEFTPDQVAGMIDLSAVRPDTTAADVRAMVEAAEKGRYLCVTTLPSYTPLAIELCAEEPTLMVSGNVAFPSGGATSACKIAEARASEPENRSSAGPGVETRPLDCRPVPHTFSSRP